MAAIASVVSGLTLSIYFAGVTACVVQLTLSAFLIRIAGERLIEGYITKLAAVAATLDMMMVMMLAGSVWLATSRSSSWLVMFIRVFGLIVWFTGNVASLIGFGFALVNSQSGLRLTRGSYDLSVAGLVIGVLGLVPEAAFIVLISPRMERETLAPVHVIEAQHLPGRGTKQDTVLGSFPLTRISTATDIGAPDVSPRSVMEWPSSPTSLLKDSIKRVIRPITSRTNLISTRSSTPRQSLSLQIDQGIPTDASRHDAFDSWDTSSVEERYEFPRYSNPQAARPALETIPGSRPMSLINALDSPHDDPAPSRNEAETPIPDSPTYPAVSPTSETSSLNLGQQLLPDQSNIHPLFRTESPGPRPVATPGTVIIASPHAGQVVGLEHALSPRKLSLSTNRAPSPAVFSRTDSNRSLRNLQFPVRSVDEESRGSGSQLSKVSSVDGES